MKNLSRLIWILAFVAISAALGAGASWYAYRAAMERLADQGRADLTLAADRLTSQLFRYRELAVILTSHPELQALLDGSGARADGDTLVRAMADKTGALSIDLVNTGGHVLASSRELPPRYDPDAMPLSRAVKGALGTHHAIYGTAFRAPERVFTFAAPVLSPEGPAVGAVITSINLRAIEDNWPGNAPAAFFVDGAGLVFVSNRSDLILTRFGEAGSFPDYRSTAISGADLWRLDGGPYLPRLALHLERELPTIGMTTHVLIDAGPAATNAALVGASTMALLLVFGAALLVAFLQRHALREKLDLEAAANARLETRVEARTRELAGANMDLRHEIGERKEAEAALKRLQDELVQAEKLSALGKMSAGISHELNQPLMAIRSFAENGEEFFNRGKPEVARENLGRIAELARRMGRIIQNLRAFARQESGPVSDVDLGAIVEAALEMTQEKAARGEVEVLWTRPAAKVLVRGGEVRLQQVLVNLLSNAVDALAGQEAPRRVEIGIETGAQAVQLTVRDTGPGLSDPERVFDPFYTTKSVGAAEGMGLGLSISYGLVQGFGGTLRAGNHPDGGAVFTIDLIRAEEVAA